MKQIAANLQVKKTNAGNAKTYFTETKVDFVLRLKVKTLVDCQME